MYRYVFSNHPPPSPLHTRPRCCQTSPPIRTHQAPPHGGTTPASSPPGGPTPPGAPPPAAAPRAASLGTQQRRPALPPPHPPPPHLPPPPPSARARARAGRKCRRPSRGAAGRRAAPPPVVGRPRPNAARRTSRRRGSGRSAPVVVVLRGGVSFVCVRVGLAMTEGSPPSLHDNPRPPRPPVRRTREQQRSASRPEAGRREKRRAIALGGSRSKCPAPSPLCCCWPMLAGAAAVGAAAVAAVVIWLACSLEMSGCCGAGRVYVCTAVSVCLSPISSPGGRVSASSVCGSRRRITTVLAAWLESRARSPLASVRVCVDVSVRSMGVSPGSCVCPILAVGCAKVCRPSPGSPSFKYKQLTWGWPRGQSNSHHIQPPHAPPRAGAGGECVLRGTRRVAADTGGNLTSAKSGLWGGRACPTAQGQNNTQGARRAQQTGRCGGLNQPASEGGLEGSSGRKGPTGFTSVD